MTHDVHEVVMCVVTAIVRDNGSDSVVTVMSKFGPDLEMDTLDIGEAIAKIEEIIHVQLPDGEISERSAVAELIELAEYRLYEQSQSGT